MRWYKVTSLKRYIRFNHNYPSDNIVYENDNVIIVEHPNGTATYDKHTGMLISWEGNA